MILFCYVVYIQKTDLNFGRVCLLPCVSHVSFYVIHKAYPCVIRYGQPNGNHLPNQRCVLWDVRIIKSPVSYVMTGSKRTDVAS